MGKHSYKKRRRKWSEQEGYRGALVRMLPAVLMVGFVPLILCQFEYKTGMESYPWCHGASVDYDLFLGWKSVTLTVLAAVMAFCVLSRLRKEGKRLSFSKALLPLFGYGLLAFLSACFSVKSQYSFFGSFEHFETVWVLLSYVLIVYYSFLYAESELELQVLTDALCFNGTLIGLMGTLQGLGFNFLMWNWVQKLITTEEILSGMGGEITTSFANTQAVATLYNPNYLGVYGAMMVPFLVMLLLHEKNKWRRLWHGVNVILVFIALLSSRSRAGLVTAVAVLCIAAVLAMYKLMKWWYLTIPAINFLVVLVLLINAYNDNVIFDRLKNMFAADEVQIAEEVAEDGTVIRKTGLTELYIINEGVVFQYNGERRLINFYEDANSIAFDIIDEMGNPEAVKPIEDGTVFSFTHPAFADIRIAPVYIGDRLGFQLRADGNWNFIYSGIKGRYQYITVYGKLSDMVMADSFGLENHQRAFSGRGYLWSRTLPLLKEHIFLGSGPDTFMLEFPQEDYLQAKKNGYEGMIITKPHSWYLQVGVQTGLISLLCLLVFYGWYAIECIRLYAFRKLTIQTEAFGIAAFMGSIGFMVSGLTNDSMVVTSPVFWGMVALGFATNHHVKKNRVKE